MNKIITIFRESKLARFFLPLGIILLVFGIIMFSVNSKNQNYLKTEATVTGTQLSTAAYTDPDGTYHDATYTVYIKYSVNDREYNGELNELPNYDKGKKITIYYNPNDPTQITMTISMILPIIIIIAGIASLVVSIVSIIKLKSR